MAEKMNIYETICAVMSDVGAVGKNSRNSQQNFMFRGIDAVMNALNPAMVKHHLFVVPEILEQAREERVNSKGTTLIYSICKIRYTFYAEDGSSVSAVVIGEGMDTGDKATNKAMSIAFKYACFQVFCIPTEEMKQDDPDNEVHEVKASGSSKKPVSPSKQDEMAKLVNSLMWQLKRTGVGLNGLLQAYGVEKVEDMTEQQLASAIAQLSVKPEKAAEPKKPAKPPVNTGFQSGTPEGCDEGLPFR